MHTYPYINLQRWWAVCRPGAIWAFCGHSILTSGIQTCLGPFHLTCNRNHVFQKEQKVRDREPVGCPNQRGKCKWTCDPNVDRCPGSLWTRCTHPAVAEYYQGQTESIGTTLQVEFSLLPTTAAKTRPRELLQTLTASPPPLAAVPRSLKTCIRNLATTQLSSSVDASPRDNDAALPYPHRPPADPRPCPPHPSGCYAVPRCAAFLSHRGPRRRCLQ